CLFSRPSDTSTGMGSGSRSAVLFRQTSASSGYPFAFSGRKNRYHLDGAWATGDGSPAVDWADYRRKLKEVGGGDGGYRLLDESPWKAAHPLKLLEQPPPANPNEAFRPNDQLSDLRFAGPGGRETVVGVERIGSEDFTPGLRPSPRTEAVTLARHERL